MQILLETREAARRRGEVDPALRADLLTPCLMRPIYVIIVVCPPSWLATLFMKTLKPLHCYVRSTRAQ
jgi:hypothetical protein